MIWYGKKKRKKNIMGRKRNVKCSWGKPKKKVWLVHLVRRTTQRKEKKERRFLRHGGTHQRCGASLYHYGILEFDGKMQLLLHGIPKTKLHDGLFIHIFQFSLLLFFSLSLFQKKKKVKYYSLVTLFLVLFMAFWIL